MGWPVRRVVVGDNEILEPVLFPRYMITLPRERLPVMGLPNVLFLFCIYYTPFLHALTCVPLPYALTFWDWVPELRVDMGGTHKSSVVMGGGHVRPVVDICQAVVAVTAQ